MSTNLARQPIEQTFFSASLTVQTTVTPLASQLMLPSMIQAFMLCNYSTNANSVFFGDNNVTTTSGIELQTGTSLLFNIIQDRQLYELQDTETAIAELTAQIANVGACQYTPVAIPVIVWNPSNAYLIATGGATTIGILFFRNVYT